MGPPGGHLLVPKVLKVVQFAIARTNELVRSKLPTNATARVAAELSYARNHPTPPLAYLKQTRRQTSRSFTTRARILISSVTKPRGPRCERSKFQVSRICGAVQQGGVSPFASTLRPNLTGGTLHRTAGGYSLGGAGNARYFSHTSGCQAQVANNVSAGIRAFFVGGGKVRYDGVDPVTGEKRFTSVTATQEKAYKCFGRSRDHTRGTNILFKTAPTITALKPIFSQQGGDTATTLQTPELLSALSGDFARSLRSLSQVLNDLNRLSAFGELPISLTDTPEGPVLSVRFPGCDADLVVRLCEEVGVTRGIVEEDEAWHNDKAVQMALLFPFAPTESEDSVSHMHASDYFFRNNAALDEVRQEQLDSQDALLDSEHSIHGKYKDALGFEQVALRSQALHPASPSGYESLEEPEAWTPSPGSPFETHSVAPSGSQDYRGVEGIYRFLQVCDESRR